MPVILLEAIKHLEESGENFVFAWEDAAVISLKLLYAGIVFLPPLLLLRSIRKSKELIDDVLEDVEEAVEDFKESVDVVDDLIE